MDTIQKKAREEGVSLQQKTKAIYLPLIDMPPAEYDTVLTSMLQVKRLSELAGQPFTVLTFDQQLYRYAVEIQWAILMHSPFCFSDKTWGHTHAREFHWCCVLGTDVDGKI